jgi:hypothetical protein
MTRPEEQTQITEEALKGGFKADAGKARLDLVPPIVLRRLINEAISQSAYPIETKRRLETVSDAVCGFWKDSSSEKLWIAIHNSNDLLSEDEGIAYADAVLKLGELYEIGSKKYAARNWEKGMDWGRCFSAMARHLLKFIKGEKYDEVDGQHHLTSVVWCAVALLHFANNPEKYASFDSRNDITVAKDKGQK